LSIKMGGSLARAWSEGGGITTSRGTRPGPKIYRFRVVGERNPCGWIQKRRPAPASRPGADASGLLDHPVLRISRGGPGSTYRSIGARAGPRASEVKERRMGSRPPKPGWGRLRFLGRRLGILEHL